MFDVWKECRGESVIIYFGDILMLFVTKEEKLRVNKVSKLFENLKTTSLTLFIQFCI